jgi:hypothetical protein
MIEEHDVSYKSQIEEVNRQIEALIKELSGKE